MTQITDPSGEDALPLPPNKVPVETVRDFILWIFSRPDPEPVGITREPIKSNLVDGSWERPTTTREEIIKSLPTLELEPSGHKQPRRIISPARGEHITVPHDFWPKGASVGADGTGPCHGLIIHGDDRTHVLHCDGANNEVAELRTIDILDNSDVYLFGGNKNPLSVAQLEDIVDYLRGRGIEPIFSNTVGLWLDDEGNPRIHKSDKELAN